MPEPNVAIERDDVDSSRLMETTLLHDLSRWREQLARSIARNRPELRSDQIATTVNQFLFSLLLLRFAEDRRLVRAGTLTGLENVSLSDLLCTLAPYADALYAGGPTGSLFSTNPESDPVLDVRVVQTILKRVTAPERQYHGTRMSTEAISRVLARYLTRTVRRSASHQATVVDTHDTELAGVAEMPPVHLIGYQVRQALGAARKNRSRHDPLPFRVFDPACGSGTVLLVIFRHLVTSQAGVSMSCEECREILSDCVYGLDSSWHAVAATRMILVLGLFEDCYADHPFTAFPDTALSILRDLRHTILCGNALVDPGIIHEESWMFCPPGVRHTLNPFVYGERFPEIIASGGFDAVICNPPEGSLEQREWIQHYFQRRYAVFHPRADRSAYFIEKAISLLRPGGIASFLMSSRWLRGSSGEPLREFVSERQIVIITDLSGIPKGTPGAGLCILCVRAASRTHPFSAVAAGAGFMEEPDAFAARNAFPVRKRQLGPGGWTLRDTRGEEILRKVHIDSTLLGELVMGQVHSGLMFPVYDPFMIEESRAREWLRKDPRCKPLLRRFIRGSEIDRYCSRTRSFFLLIPEGWTRSHKNATMKPWQWLKRRHPAIAQYLITVEAHLRSRARPETLWWESGSDIFWQEPRKKILFPVQSGRPGFFFDNGRGICDEETNAIPSSSLFLCGVLNSRLMQFVLEHNGLAQHYEQKCTWDKIRLLPIRTPDFDRPEEILLSEQMEQHVRKMLELEKNCRSEDAIDEHEGLWQKVRATDAKIDALVYELYGLTANEIAVVEEAVGRNNSPS